MLSTRQVYFHSVFLLFLLIHNNRTLIDVDYVIYSSSCFWKYIPINVLTDQQNNSYDTTTSASLYIVYTDYWECMSGYRSRHTSSSLVAASNSSTIRFSVYDAPHIDSSAKVVSVIFTSYE